VERQSHVSTATLRGARAVGIVCAAAFFAPVVLSLAFPDPFLYAPYHRTYERMLGAIVGALGIGLLLALRDPVRNAGVFAVIGLTAGSLDAATIYSLVFDGAAPSHWLTTVPLLGAVAVALVVTYTRLRRPHPVVVRIVVAAVLLLPVALYLHDAASRAFVRP
jgi:peptidoglycan/LPS O-acetylase OafA/YrhL